MQRRTVLQLLGTTGVIAAMGSAGAAYRFLNKPHFDWCFLETPRLKDAVHIPAGPKTEIYSEQLPPEIIEVARKDWKKTWEGIKQDWYNDGGTGRAQTNLDKAWTQGHFTQETDQIRADAYREYAQTIMPIVWNRVMHPGRMEFVICRGPEHNPASVGIVNRLFHGYCTRITLSEEGRKPQFFERWYFGDEGSAGERQTRASWGNGNPYVINGPLLLATANKKRYTAIETPILEAVHEAIRESHERAFLKSFKEENKDLGDKLILLNEGVSHAVGIRLLLDLREEYDLPISLDEIAEQRKDWAAQSKYQKVAPAEEKVKTEGLNLAHRFNKDPLALVKEFF